MSHDSHAPDGAIGADAEIAAWAPSGAACPRSWQKPRFLPAAYEVMSAEIAAGNFRQWTIAIAALEFLERSREVANEPVDAALGGTSTSPREDITAPRSGSAV